MTLPSDWGPASVTGLLPVTNQHHIYFAVYGEAGGDDVVILHGGPGSGSNLDTLQFFDPARHRVIFFDQRGAGRSLPAGSVSNNTTAHLVSDMEALRKALGSGCWTVFGGSWGSILGLVYASEHPAKCERVVLRGMPLWGKKQTKWALEGRRRLMPQRYLQIEEISGPTTNPSFLEDLSAAIGSDDDMTVQRAVKTVLLLETGLHGPIPEPEIDSTTLDVTPEDTQRATIYLHYWRQGWLVPDLDKLDWEALSELDIYLLHGASDWICPVDGSRDIKQRLPCAKLIVVPDIGHSPFAPKMAAEIRRVLATKKRQEC